VAEPDDRRTVRALDYDFAERSPRLRLGGKEDVRVSHRFSESGAKRRMGAGPPLGELPECAVPDRLTDTTDFLDRHEEIVVRKPTFALDRGEPSDLWEGSFGAEEARTRGFADFVQRDRTVGGHDAPAARELVVGGGIEEVDPEERREREGHGVSSAEEMDRGRRPEGGACGDEDTDELGKPVLLHQRNNAPDGEHVPDFARTESRSCPQLCVRTALNGHREKPGPARPGLSGPLHRGLESPFGLVAILLGLRELVEDRCNVAPDPALERHNLFGGDLDRAVGVLLERARIGHHRAIEPDQSVDPVALGNFPKRRSSPSDVRRCDHRANPEARAHLLGRHWLPLGIRVDHRKERRGLHRPVRRRKPTQTSESIPVEELEIHRPGASERRVKPGASPGPRPLPTTLESARGVRPAWTG